MREIYVDGSDKPALVDDEDYEKVSKYNWSLGGNQVKYARVTTGGRTVYMHHLVLGVFDPDKLWPIEHMDDNYLNNQKINLLESTCSANQQGVPKPKTAVIQSNYLGVSWHKHRQKWMVKVSKDGIQYHVGYFYSEQEAAKAYNEAAKKLYGKRARLNLL